MKFVVSSTALLNVLQTSSKVVSNKNTLPILDNFLFDLKEGVLKITASDLETTLIGSLKVDNMERRRTDRRPGKTDARLAERVLGTAADDRGQRIDLGDPGKLENRQADHSRHFGAELSEPARAECRNQAGNSTSDADMLLYGHQQNDFRDGRRRTASGDERRLHQHRTAERLRSWRPTRTSWSNTRRRSKPKSTASFILPKKPANLLRGMLGKEERKYPDGIRRQKRDVPPEKPYADLPADRGQLSRTTTPSSRANNPNQRAGRPRRTAQRHPPRGRLLEPIYEPDQDRHRIEHDQPDGAGPGFFGIGPGVAGLRVRRRGYRRSVSNRPSSSRFWRTSRRKTSCCELADSTRAGVFKPVYDEAPATDTLMLLMPMMINA